MTCNCGYCHHLRQKSVDKPQPEKLTLAQVIAKIAAKILK